jgi:hypothetical protein
MATIYCDASALGTNAGTSWTNAYTNPWSAFNLMNPGDIIYLRGNFTIGTQMNFARGGTANSYIQIVGCNSSGIADGTKIKFTAGAGVANIIRSNAAIANFYFKNIIFSGGTTAFYCYRAFTDSSFENCEFNDAGTGYNTAGVVTSIRFYKCAAKNNTGVGLSVSSTNVYGCYFYNNTGNALQLYGNNSLVINSLFVDNKNAAVVLINASELCLNNVFDGNPYGIYITGTNCRVIGNCVTNSTQYGIYSTTPSVFEDYNYGYNNTIATYGEPYLGSGNNSDWSGAEDPYQSRTDGNYNLSSGFSQRRIQLFLDDINYSCISSGFNPLDLHSITQTTAIILNNNTMIDIIYNILINDTTTLYGNGKLVGKDCIIKTNPEFKQAKVDTKNPYKIFLNSDRTENIETRAWNRDFAITVDYRVEGLANDPNVANSRIDSIISQISAIMNDQNYTGKLFTDYYDSTVYKVLDIETSGSISSVVSENNQWRVHGEGTIRVLVNHTP